MDAKRDTKNTLDRLDILQYKLYLNTDVVTREVPSLSSSRHSSRRTPPPACSPAAPDSPGR